MAEIVNGNGINETHANVKRSRSTFPLKQIILDTHRFGEYHPHLVIDGVTSDKLPFRSAHDARSFTLKAPLMQNIQMHKDYFMVPLRAILPLNADKIITNPTIGDDVPSDAYTNVSDFISKIRSISSAFVSAITTEAAEDTPDAKKMCTLMIKHFVFLESVFSNGSLLASLGCNLNTCFGLSAGNNSPEAQHIATYENGAVTRIDEAFDNLISRIKSAIIASGKSLSVEIDQDDDIYVSDTVRQDGGQYNSNQIISWHEFLMRVRDTSDWLIDGNPLSANAASIISSIYNGLTFSFTSVSDNKLDIDLARLWSYHLCCAAFYTNDKVDYIYSAELFRQYIWSLVVLEGVDSGNFDSSGCYFSYNGNRLQYDYLSAKVFNLWASVLSSSISDPYDLLYGLQYFLTLFGYHRSLRFKDYFTGSRTRPLAVGDTSIPVVGGNVSVIDVSRNIQVQRFLNAVNATGRKFEEYLKGIFGVAPSPDHHNPLFLAHTTDDIFAAEVENTGEAQQTAANSVTAIFRGNSNKYAFEVDVNEPCIILGITSYDIERSYSTIVERSFFTKDRFDMFLPQLQYVGDQPIYKAELDPSLGNPMSAFGYQFRDMDRKQLVNRSVGGFASDKLPGYSFSISRRSYEEHNISPDFIRSKNAELDPFYLALTGYSLGTYFHFIVRNYNTCNASRPMAVNPQILG